jgi:hypothetical protein
MTAYGTDLPLIGLSERERAEKAVASSPSLSFPSLTSLVSLRSRSNSVKASMEKEPLAPRPDPILFHALKLPLFDRLRGQSTFVLPSYTSELRVYPVRKTHRPCFCFSPPLRDPQHRRATVRLPSLPRIDEHFVDLPRFADLWSYPLPFLSYSRMPTTKTPRSTRSRRALRR